MGAMDWRWGSARGYWSPLPPRQVLEPLNFFFNEELLACKIIFLSLKEEFYL